MASPPTALVTGASGMVGLNLIEKLVSSGWRVVAVVRRGYEVRRPWARRVLSRVERVTADITCYSSIKSALEGVEGLRDYTLYHLAAVLYASKRRIWDVNFRGTLKLLRAIREVGVIPECIVFTSSLLALGDTLAVSTGEYSEAKPRTTYERSKFLSEVTIQRFSRSEGVRHVIFRPIWVYGRYTRNADFILLAKLAKLGIAVHPTWNLRLHMVYAGTLASLLEEAGRPGSKVKGIYNVAESTAYRLDEIMKAMAEAAGRRIHFLLPMPRVLTELASPAIDMFRFMRLSPGKVELDRLHRYFKVRPEPSLVWGMRASIRWLMSVGLI